MKLNRLESTTQRISHDAVERGFQEGFARYAQAIEQGHVGQDAQVYHRITDAGAWYGRFPVPGGYAERQVLDGEVAIRRNGDPGA